MAYRKRTRCSAKLAAVRASAARLRMASPAPDYIPQMPELRRTIIIIEHRLEDVLHRRIDRVILMAEGRIVADLPPEELI